MYTEKGRLTLNLFQLTISFLLGELAIAQACTNQELGIDNNNRLQVCVQNQWMTICERGDKWDVHAANVACKQMGYNDNGATVTTKCKTNSNSGYVYIGGCSGTENSLESCMLANVQFNACQRKNCGNNRKHPVVTCQEVNCKDHDVRLVGGSTNREGRVEVCMDGRWGTVCNNSQEGIAEEVCSQLGFPAEGAGIAEDLSPGTAPIQTCTILEGRIDCHPMSDQSCNHTMDLRVKCKTHQEIIEQVMNNTISDVLLNECPGSQTTATLTSCYACNESTTSTADGNAALRGVVGFMVIVLVVLVIGWSLSCVALVKRNSHTQKQTELLGSRNNENSTQCHMTNPVYGANTDTHNYSSSGPTYELIDTLEGTGQTYSVLEQCQENRTKPSKTATEDEDHDYHLQGSGELESGTSMMGECEGVTGRACDYEVPVSGQTHSLVKKSTLLYKTNTESFEKVHV